MFEDISCFGHKSSGFVGRHLLFVFQSCVEDVFLPPSGIISFGQRVFLGELFSVFVFTRSHTEETF